MKTLVISVGGSVIVTDKGVNFKFLKEFRKIVLAYARRNRVVIVCGGGTTARNYIIASKKIAKVSDYDADWVGIAATKLNAELVRAVFGKAAYDKVVFEPKKKIKTTKKVIIASGWIPGWSSDMDAVLLAQNLRADTVVNMSNVKYVYDKDPNKYRTAQKIKEMDYKRMQSIVGTKWIPGSNLPFDPIATKLAAKLKLRLVILNNNLTNFKKLLAGKKFAGTVIR